MGVRQWLGIGGSSDGSATGSLSLWKVVSGVGSVVDTTLSGLVTTLDTVVDNILGQLDVKLSTRATEATLLTIDADTGAIKTATEKVATETAAGDGVRVKQETASKFNCTEASASSIKTAVELIDDPVVAQDANASKAMTAGVELVDPAAWPANGTAGKIRRLIGNLKGMLVTTLGEKIAGEDITADRMLVLTRANPGDGGMAIAASGTAHSVPCTVVRLFASESGTANSYTVQLKDNGAGGTAKTIVFTVLAGASLVLDIGVPFSTNVYAVIAGAGTPAVGVTVVNS